MSDSPDVVEAVAERLRPPRGPVLVGIDGPDGAGKTTFADRLAVVLRAAGHVVVRASVDDFHHPRAHRHAEGRTPATVWARHFDLGALRRELLDPWCAGSGSSYRTRWHDLTTDELVVVPPAVIPEDAVLVVDGVFLQREELAGVWDLTVYLDVQDAVGLRRVEQRDGGLDDPARYAGAQRIYRSRCDPLERADVVVDNAEPGAPVIIRNANDVPGEAER